jgi:hypothetical protein
MLGYGFCLFLNSVFGLPGNKKTFACTEKLPSCFKKLAGSGLWAVEKKVLRNDSLARLLLKYYLYFAGMVQ